MRNLFSTMLCIGTLSLSTSALAATISPENGDLLVNSGKGYKTISGTTRLEPGTQVLVSVNGTAIITYSADCSVRIGSGTVWTIAAEIPCTKTANFIDFSKASFVGGAPAIPTPPPTLPPPVPAVGGLGGFGATGLAVAGVAAAGAIGIGVAVSQRKKKKDDPVADVVPVDVVPVGEELGTVDTPASP